MSSELDEDTIDIPFEVWPHEHGSRADVFLARRLKRLSRSRAAMIIRNGQLKTDAHPIHKPSTRVFVGERVLLTRRKLTELPTGDVCLPVVYEDAAVLAVHKPGDLVVHPTASAYRRTLIRILRDRRQEPALDLAHRIDKETSGIVLLARSFAASSSLKTQFAERVVKKAYLAVVRGLPEADTFLLDAPMRLAPDSLSGVRMELHGEGASVAETEVTVLARGPSAALVEARPRTGRQHQIRLHLAGAGFPLIGDKLYLGGEELFVAALRGLLEPEEVRAAVGHDRQALHAFRLGFRHPDQDGWIEICAPLAPDLVTLCVSLAIPVPAACLGLGACAEG